MKLLSLIFALLVTAQASPVPSLSEIIPFSPETNHILSSRQSIVSRTIHISSVIKIHDDETFGDDDFTRSTTLSPIVLGTAAGFTRQVSYNAKAGGEIRVEVLLTLTLRPSDLAVQVSYLVKLFEGTSENTNDLDGQVEGSDTVRKDRTVDIKTRVRNEDEGGDRADLTLTVVNAP